VIFSDIKLVELTGIINRAMIKRNALYSKGNFYADEAEWTAQQHLGEAQRYREQSIYDSATRHTFLAFLLSLQDYNLLEIKRWKTNWEYANELSSNQPSLVPQYQEAASFFEKVTYGDEQVNEDQFLHYYENMMKWIDKLESWRKAGEEK